MTTMRAAIHLTHRLSLRAILQPEHSITLLNPFFLPPFTNGIRGVICKMWKKSEGEPLGLISLTWKVFLLLV
jgi:hypothetical protein